MHRCSMSFSKNYKSTWGYGLTVSYFFSKLPLIFLGRFIWFIHLFIVCIYIHIYTYFYTDRCLLCFNFNTPRTFHDLLEEENGWHFSSHFSSKATARHCSSTQLRSISLPWSFVLQKPWKKRTKPLDVVAVIVGTCWDNVVREGGRILQFELYCDFMWYGLTVFVFFYHWLWCALFILMYDCYSC